MEYSKNSKPDEQSLQHARVSLLANVFEQFWIQPQISPFNEHKSTRSPSFTHDLSFDSTALPSSPWYIRFGCQLCLIVLVLVIIVLLLLSLPYMIRSQDRANRFIHQCTSLACISASYRIMKNLDSTIDPCENFFKYTCDGWLHSRFLTPSETSHSYFKEIYRKNTEILYDLIKNNSIIYKNFPSNTMKKLKHYFNACMDTAGNERTAKDTVIDILTRAGKSPLFFDDWSSHDFDLVSGLVYVHWHKINPLFRVGITVDDKNNNYHRIYFEQAGLSFDERSHYHHGNLHRLFKHFGVSLARLLRRTSSSNRIHLAKQVHEVFLFEKRLANLFQTRQPMNPFKLYNICSYDEIRMWFSPWLDIDVYLKRFFASDFRNQTILVSTPIYFEQLNRVIRTTPMRTIANYVALQIVQELLPYMPESYLTIRRPLLVYLKGIAEEKPLWERCVKRTDDAFGFATGALFITKAFDRMSKKKIEQIVEEIRLTFIETLPKIEWMDVETRRRAQIKATMITDRLGYPEWLENGQTIDRYYQNLILSSTNNPINNLMLVRRFYKEKNLRKLHRHPGIEEWTMTPMDVNAYYAPWKNMIVFPAGILQAPFFDANVPISLNFGSIASIVGHELIHAFDASGRYFDGRGNLNNWWQTESARNFNQRAQCFVDQYAQYRIGKKHINGLLTLDENIADNGGLRIAYMAYKRYLQRYHLGSRQHEKQQQLLPGLNLTDEQLFFIGFAQTWCTKTTSRAAEVTLVTDTHTFPEYRVIGSLSNMPEFSQAFQCSAKSRMNPAKRCQIWLATGTE